MDFTGFALELERLRPVAIAAALPNLALLSRTDSTNRVAKTVAECYESEGLDVIPLLALAYEQSGGRGRLGRSWSSPRGKGVYATLLLPLNATERLETLPLLVGIGLCRALAPHLSAPCRLKWPNDLIVELPPGSPVAPAGTDTGRRKIGGILIEASTRPDVGSTAFIGFGVNHGHEAAELPPGATSLALAGEKGGPGVTLPELVWQLVDSVLCELEHLGDTEYTVAAYRELSVHQLGERLACRTGETQVEGVFRGFDERGLLLLETAAGEQLRIAAGEVIE